MIYNKKSFDICLFIYDDFYVNDEYQLLSYSHHLIVND